MSLTEIVVITLAGMAAGCINTIVGSGTLVTFPTLLAFGFPAVTANISNTVGLVAGGVSGAWGYRSEMEGAAPLLRRLSLMSFVGAIVGAVLLVVLPASAFDAIVPLLILIGVLLVVFGPRLQRMASAHHDEGVHRTRWALLQPGVFLCGVYGGYFGAAQGVILMGLMGVLLAEPMQKLNGIKNVLALIVNLTAAITFLIVSWDKVNWAAAALIAVGSLIGGVIGARVGKRLPPNGLRAFIVIIGVIAIVRLLFG